MATTTMDAPQRHWRTLHQAQHHRHHLHQPPLPATVVLQLLQQQPLQQRRRRQLRPHPHPPDDDDGGNDDGGVGHVDVSVVGAHDDGGRGHGHGRGRGGVGAGADGGRRDAKDASYGERPPSVPPKRPEPPVRIRFVNWS